MPTPEPAPQPASEKKKRRNPDSPGRKIFREVLQDPGTIHPALIPGIAIEDDSVRYTVNRKVFIFTAAAVVLFVGWGISDLDRLAKYSGAGVTWVSDNFGWLFSLLTLAVALYMFVLAYTKFGRIPLGKDGEEPEFSRASWIAMMFSAGMGIGLLFFGAYEPLAFFLDTPPGADSVPGSVDGMYTAMAQTILHWGPMAWTYYALVGGAISYSAYRRGRSPLISSIFAPIFTDKIGGPVGSIIDGFAILVTLFGTAVSLGLGALQIGRGLEIVTGIGPVGNGLIVAIMVILTIGFIFSAVSGVKKGIRRLSNLNMLIVLGMGLFVFIAGPTLFLLDFIPNSAVAFVKEFLLMIMRSPADGPEAATFMESWTTYYWAWWISWTPFVGLFIAKISRGRTIREFVTVIVLVPGLVTLVWFGIFGGTAMWMQRETGALAAFEESQDVLFMMFDGLPIPAVLSAIAMVALAIFFITSADSASLVMGSMTQYGKPVPYRSITITWGVSLTIIAITLLLAGGEGSLSSLQALVTISALPFAVVLIGVMIAWWKDLSTDPLILRQRYAEVAIEEGVRIGIEEFGDDFAFSTDVVETEHGAGAWLDTEDPVLTEWYEEAVEDAIATAEDKPLKLEESEFSEHERIDPAPVKEQITRAPADPPPADSSLVDPPPSDPPLADPSSAESPDSSSQDPAGEGPANPR